MKKSTNISPLVVVISLISAFVPCCSDDHPSSTDSGPDGGDADSDSDADSGSDTDADACDGECVFEDTFDESACPTTYDGVMVVYVDGNVVEPGDGLSWAASLSTVQEGIDAARCAAISSGSCQVWVAGGTYNVFQKYHCDTVRLRSGVEVYGGFAGDETVLEERDIAAHPSVLDGHDETGACRVYHVVVGADNAAIDGLTITGGYAGTDPPHNVGGGMLNVDVSPEVANCTFTANEAYAYDNAEIEPQDDWPHALGAGMYNSNASPIVTDSKFSENRAWAESYNCGRADASGGGVYNTGGSAPVFTDCLFEENTAGGEDLYYSDCGGAGGGAGAAVNNESMPTFSGCTFQGNLNGGVIEQRSQSTYIDCLFEGNLAGGGLYSADGTLVLQSCSFEDNECEPAAGALNLRKSLDSELSGAATIEDCVFENNHSGESTGAVAIYYDDSVDPIVISNSVFLNNDGTDGGAISNSYVDLRITDCLFQNNEAYTGGAIRSNNGQTSGTLIEDSLFLNNVAWEWGGAVVNDSGSLVLKGCTFSGNTATDAGGAIGTQLHESWDSTDLTGCVLWGDLPDEIYHNQDPILEITYSDIQGGYDGNGNINLDPLFVDPGGDDYHLQLGSPCIDAADGEEAPEFDYDGNPRVDDPDVANTGLGPPWADMGAFERQP